MSALEIAGIIVGFFGISFGFAMFAGPSMSENTPPGREAGLGCIITLVSAIIFFVSLIKLIP